jgi:hypothetical protein
VVGGEVVADVVDVVEEDVGDVPAGVDDEEVAWGLDVEVTRSVVEDANVVGEAEAMTPVRGRLFTSEPAALTAT